MSFANLIDFTKYISVCIVKKYCFLKSAVHKQHVDTTLEGSVSIFVGSLILSLLFSK